MSAEKPTAKGGGRFYVSDSVSVTESEFSASPMSLRDEIQKRKEKQMLDEDAEFTYKPRLISKSRKSSEKEKAEENRFDRLYSDASKRHLESKWKESIEDKDLTFKPKISSKGSNSRATSRERGATVESIASRLSSPRTKPVEAEQFSFKPTITKRAKSIDRSQHRETPERLYLHSKVAKEKQEKLKQDFDQKELEECTFAPKSFAKRLVSVPSSKALHERMEQYEERKAMRLEEAIRVREETEVMEATFRPTIKTTKRSATPTKVCVYERLTASVDRSIESLPSYQEEQAQLTFTPRLISKRAPSPSPRSTTGGSEYKNVHDRLFREGQARRRELEVERQLLQEENEAHLTFTPVINPRSRDVASADKDREGGPVFERLATTSNRQHMQEVLAKIKTDLEMRDCTFKPKFHTEPRSSSKDKSSDPVYVRLTQEGERVRAEQQRAAEKRAAEEVYGLTFSPQIPERSASIARRRSTLVANASSEGSVAPEENVYERLAGTPKSSAAPVAPESNATSKSDSVKHVVLPKQDLEKVFRRLSITTTQSLAAPKEGESMAPGAATTPLRSSMSVPASEGTPVATVKKTVQLPEAARDQALSNLSLKRTASWSQRLAAHEEEQSPSPKVTPKNIKQMPESSLDQVFRRLSTTQLASFSADSADGGPADSSPSRMSRKHSNSNMFVGGTAADSTLKGMSRKLSNSNMATNSTTSTKAVVAPVTKSVAEGNSANTTETTVIGSTSEPAETPESSLLPSAQQKGIAAAAMPPVPPVSVTTGVKPKTRSLVATAPVTNGGGGDVFSKLEASLRLLESSQLAGDNGVAATDVPPTTVVAAAAAAEKSTAPATRGAAGSKIPVSPKDGAAANKTAGQGNGKSIAESFASAAAAPAAKVLKGKKKSTDDSMASGGNSASTSQNIDSSAPVQPPLPAVSEPRDDAARFLDAIPHITTEGSDSDSAPEEH